MESILMTNSRIPIILTVLGLVIFLSSVISFKVSRKVQVEKRKSTYMKRKNSFIRLLLIKFIEGSEFFTELQNKLAFNLGYLYPTSEKKNKEKALDWLVNFCIFFIFEFVLVLILIPKLGLFLKLIIIFAIYISQVVTFKLYISGKKANLKNYFPLMLSPYIPAYVDTQNIKESFKKALNEMPSIYHIHIQRIINEVNSGVSISTSLENFERRVDYVLCSSFVAIIKGATISNKDIADNLVNLQILVATDRANDKKTKERLKDRKGNLYFLCVAIICELVFVGNYVKTANGNYFLTTADGQAYLLLSIGSILIAIILIILADRT